jgi:hypothetical protein
MDAGFDAPWYVLELLYACQKIRIQINNNFKDLEYL